MKNLEKLAAECRAELLSIGILPAENISWSVNTRAVKRWGQCKKLASNAYSISISSRLLEDGVADQMAKNTIMHELLHTCKGAMKHTGTWAKLAHQVNARLPQYAIKRTTTSEEKEIAPVEAPYIIRCPACGKQYHRYRMSAVVAHPETRCCGVCGHTPLVRMK